MKNLIDPLKQEAYADLRANKAILRIHNWMHQRYPFLAAVSRTSLIRQCLMEMQDENKGFRHTQLST